MLESTKTFVHLFFVQGKTMICFTPRNVCFCVNFYLDKNMYVLPCLNKNSLNQLVSDMGSIPSTVFQRTLSKYSEYV